MSDTQDKKIQMNVMISEDLRKRVEHVRIERGGSLADLVADALELFLADEEAIRKESSL